MNLSPVQHNMQNARIGIIYSSMVGNHRGYVWNRKFLASIATENFDEFIKLPKNQNISVPLFSNIGFNMLKVTLLDLFRKKTPEEKLFRKMLLKQKAQEIIKKRVING